MMGGWLFARAVEPEGRFPRHVALLWHVAAAVLAIAAVCCLQTFTDVDIALQRRLFDSSTGEWLLSRGLHAQLKPFVYTAPKVALMALGMYCAFGLFRGVRNPVWGARRKRCVLMLLALAVVPAILAGSRSFTNMYCPSQLVEFGGDYVLQRILGPAVPANLGPGRLAGMCFPAGHASGGFALMMLFFVLRPGRASWGGLLLGLACGVAMGLYQIFRGQHFMADTLVSMAGAWGVICGLVLVTDWVWTWPWPTLARRFRRQSTP